MLKRRNQFVLIAGVCYLTLAVFSGPLRMVLTQTGLSPIIYAPNAMLLLAAGWVLADEPLRKGFSALRLLATLILLGATLIGLQFCPSRQVAMGLWVLLPFWYGLCCGVVLLQHWDTVQRPLPWFWAAAAAGVIANNFVIWPWEGFGYSVAGLDVEGAREWWAAGGTKRLAGFARSSFDAAVQVQLLGLLTALRCTRFSARMMVWLITAVAVYLTTSKAMLLVLATLTPIVLLHARIPGVLLRPLPLLVGCLGLLLPLSTLVYSFTPDTSQDAARVNALHSFYDRLNYMWPEAWQLLHEQGNALMGRGIGGIGTAQTYFEAQRFNAADNFFMYWLVVLGWFALPGFLLLLLRTLRVQPFKTQQQTVVYTLLLATFVYGLTTNIVENAAFAIASGLAIRWITGSPQDFSQPHGTQP